MNTFGNLTDTFSTVIDAVHTCHHRREGFGGTDIRCRALAFDMLLACLQRQAVRRVLVFVFAQTDDTSGHVAFVLVAGSHVSCGRTAEAHGQTEPLGGTAHDICGEGFEQREGEEVGYDRHFEPCLVAVVDEALVVLDGTVAVGPLNERTEELRRRGKVRIRAGDDLDALSRSAGTEHGEGVRPYLLIYKDLADVILHLLA